MFRNDNFIAHGWYLGHRCRCRGSHGHSNWLGGLFSVRGGSCIRAVDGEGIEVGGDDVVTVVVAGA